MVIRGGVQLPIRCVLLSILTCVAATGELEAAPVEAVTQMHPKEGSHDGSHHERVGGVKQFTMRDMMLQMREAQMEQREAAMRRVRALEQAARDAPNTWMGGLFVPLGSLLLAVVCIGNCVSPSQFSELESTVAAAATNSPPGRWARLASALARRRGWTLHDLTRLCVCSFFLHEGLSVMQNKWEQIEESRLGMWTPFGIVHALPSWEKGDACDLVLLVTACATIFNLLPEVGLLLLLADVATDTLDLLVRIGLLYMAEGVVQVNELTAKKLSLLGVMALVATHRWRQERALLTGRSTPGRPQPASPADVETDGVGLMPGTVSVAVVAELVPATVLLTGRLLMASVFFYAAGSEGARLLVPHRLSDLDPNDPHNIIWPKLVELALAIPFCLGLRTNAAARALAATLLLEALTCWPFWAMGDSTASTLELRLHAREHFTVNVAISGGLLLVAEELGGGKYAVDALLKKAS